MNKTSRKITKSMTFSEALKKNQKTAEILQSKGMHCIGCMMAGMESIETGCKSHGMSKKEIDSLINTLNE